MDDDSGLANKYNTFASFLTVSQKFKYSCNTIFQIIYPKKSIWKLIQQLTILRVILSNCIRATTGYLTQNSPWLIRRFVTLANRNENICLTLDCGGISPKGQGRFRTEADIPNEQTCYFNIENSNKLLNVFRSKITRNCEFSEDTVPFQIEPVKSKAKKKKKNEASDTTISKF